MMTSRNGSTRVSRPKIPIEMQVSVFYRDGWICRWCHRPTVFSPAFRLLAGFVERSGWRGHLAFFHPRWRRDAAPLLDHMGAVIDHVEAYAAGGEHSERNFVTACNKCNARKNSRMAAEYLRERPGRAVKGLYGEPKHWDGLVSLFLVLAQQQAQLTPSERAWERALRNHVGSALAGLSNNALHLTSGAGKVDAARR